MAGDNQVELWVSYHRRGEPPSRVWRMSLAEARRRAERERRETEARFRGAPFPLYGLPRSWEGERFLGGGSWGSDERGDSVHALSLVHGVLVEGEGPMLAVETAVPDESGGGGPLRCIAEEVWSGRARSIHEGVAFLRARWGGARHADGFSPMPSRSEAIVVVDERPVAFDVVFQPDHWVGRASVGDHVITVEGHEFPVEGLALVEIADLEPYILGTRRFEGSGEDA